MRAEVLRLLPHMLPDSAAAVSFILATSAEESALHRALREDIPADMTTANLRVHIRGSKNDDATAWPTPRSTPRGVVLHFERMCCL